MGLRVRERLRQIQGGRRPDGRESPAESLEEQRVVQGAGGPCPVCSAADRTASLTPTLGDRGGREVVRCAGCGLVELRDGHGLPNRTRGLRHGSPSRPGREHAMVLFAAGVLGPPARSVLLWQPGVSADYRRIQGIPLVSDVTAVEDESMVGESGVYATTPHDLDGRQWEIVVGAEVVQAFDDPVRGLTTLLECVSPDGLVTLSTDLYDGSDLSRNQFHRARQHRWFWTYEALEIVAGRNGFRVDARLPASAVKRNHHRKRFLYLSRSPDVMRRVRVRFGEVLHAPSEVLP